MKIISIHQYSGKNPRKREGQREREIQREIEREKETDREKEENIVFVSVVREKEILRVVKKTREIGEDESNEG